MEEAIKKEIIKNLNCTIQHFTKLGDGLYSVICKLPGGTIAQFKCELTGNELLIDTF